MMQPDRAEAATARQMSFKASDFIVFIPWFDGYNLRRDFMCSNPTMNAI